MKKVCKKAIAMFLTLALLLSFALPVSAKQTFSDVANNWSYKAIEFCYANGYMKGEGTRTFNPNGAVTRAQVVQVLYNLSEEPAVSGLSNPFTDVPVGEWFEKAVVWAKANDVVAGLSDTRFDPKGLVTRQQVCVMFYNYYQNIMKETGELQTESVMQSTYTDFGKVASWAKEAVRWAHKSGFMSGTSTTTLGPAEGAKRAQLAQFLLNFRKISGDTTVDTFQPPVYEEETQPPHEDDNPSGTAEAPVRFSKSAAGVSVSGVEVNPAGYKIRPVLANNRLYTTESASSIVSRTGAVLAVDGAFFNSSSDYNTSATIIDNGKVLKWYVEGAPYRPALVMDSAGNASIEFFKIKMPVTLMRGEETIRVSTYPTGVNTTLSSSDGTRMLYSRTYGSVAKGTYLRALEIDAGGKITKIYSKGGTDLAIPAEGYLFCEKIGKEDLAGGSKESIFDECQVGDVLVFDVQYLNDKDQKIAKQDIVSALSNGPTLVKNGKAYASDATFRQESFTDPHVIAEANAKMALGIKADGTIVIAQASCTMKKLGEVMAALGCQTAMNLDGGASCALYVNGSALIAPGRNMSNMIVFTK